MVIQFIDEKIRRAFSDAALEYDVLASLHKEIGRELIKKVRDSGDYESVLDIGMGTGWFTRRLAFWFPEARIVGIDFAQGMIDVAKSKKEGFDIIQADAKVLPFKDDVFEVIVSNLAFQWMGDIQSVFKQCFSSLKKEGELQLTLFGQNTFNELFTALEWAAKEQNTEENLSVQRLASKDDIFSAVKQAGFSDVDIDYERIRVRFPDMIGLLKWIRDIGANNLSVNTYLGKDLLNKANEYYCEHYKDRLGVYSTFEVIWLNARK